MAAERFVYVVQEQDAYETPRVIEAHLTEESATERVRLLNDLAEASPRCPDLDDADEAWDAWRAAEREWCAKHPLSDDDRSSYLNQKYEVAKLRLFVPALGVKEAPRG